MPESPAPAGRAILFAVLADALLVMLFAAIGRSSHHETLSPVDLLGTAWPFLAGAAVGWGISLAWRSPLRVWPTGVVVWLSAVVGGMLLRLASGQGVQLAFVIVATVTLAILLLGWRAVTALVSRLRARMSGARA